VPLVPLLVIVPVRHPCLAVVAVPANNNVRVEHIVAMRVGPEAGHHLVTAEIDGWMKRDLAIIRSGSEQHM